MNSSENSPRFALSTLVAPFVLFLLLTSLEPTPDKNGAFGLIPYAHYPTVYLVKLALVTLAAGVCAPAWFRMFPVQKPTLGTWLAPAVGVLGVFLWVGITKLQETFGLPGLMAGTRSAFDPFAQLAPTSAWAFWTARMFGLTLLVPFIEEIFLRGFLLRYLEGKDWQGIAVGAATRITWLGTLIYAVATHPGEPYAAVVWFSLVTYFVFRSKNIWHAVSIHVTTNFLLGIYVFLSGDWGLM